MLDNSRINFSVNNTQLFVDSLNVSQDLSLTPNYSLGCKYPIDNTYQNLTSKISISYYPITFATEANWVAINQFRDNPTGNLSLLLNIGGIEMTGYLNSYSFSIAANQAIKINVEYSVFNQITGNISNQPWSNLTFSPNLFADERGIGHAWSTRFYKNRIENTTGNLIQIDYNFNSNIIPKYNIGSAFPSQIMVLNADESLNITHETQCNNIFSGKKFETIFSQIDTIALYNLSQNWGGEISYISFPVSGFTLESTKFNIKPQDSIFFENSFRKFY